MAEEKKGKKKPSIDIEEIPGGARPIEAVGTSVAAFIGIAPVKPLRLAVTALVLVAVARALRSR